MAMIITRTPLRISFVGGGSDLPWFYQEDPGAAVSAAINKYVYVAVKPEFTGRVLAHYRATENVACVADLKHDRMRACLLSAGIRDAIEVASMADVPGSTGLGSSSAFTVGLLRALHPEIGPPDIFARHACEIEINECEASIGKQDQYTAAYGGLNLLRFGRDRVSVEPIACDLEALGARLLLFDTGIVRQDDAGRVLTAQQRDREGIRELATLAEPFASALGWGNFATCGEIMDWAWSIKRRFVGDLIDHQYAAALAAGAWGGKLCGAGGGGFLLFLAPPERHAAIMEALGLRHVPIALVPHGSQVIYAA